MPRLIRKFLAGLMGLLFLAGGAGAGTVTAPRVVATYFHRTLRCHTCMHIESLAQYDVTNVLARELESGRLEWRLLNFEKEENAHFVDDFDLESPTLVIAIEEDGQVLQWTRLDRVWDLTEDVEAFDSYVLGSVERYLQVASDLASRENGAPRQEK